MITEFGGAVAVPSAVRKSDSTTTMRVNDVIMIRMEGATERMVNSAINWIARSVTPPPPWPKLMLISCASAGSASDPAAIRAVRKKTLRGRAANLTKSSSAGPAARPFRLQDSQSWSSAAQERASRCGRAALAGRAGLPAGPAGRHCRRRRVGAAPLRAVAPFPLDSDRLKIQAGAEEAAGAEAERQRDRAPASAPRPGATDAASMARCAA